MTKFVMVLHVLAAVFLIGPMAIAPMIGMRAIRKHDARGVHEAARTTTLYTLLSLVVAGLGLVLTAVGSKYWSFGDVWIVVSLTLYVIALLLGIGVVSPGLTAAARLLDASTSVPATPLSPPTVTDATVAEAPEPAGTDTATIDVEARRKVDAAYGRVAASSGIVALLLIIVVVLMVWHPES